MESNRRPTFAPGGLRMRGRHMETFDELYYTDTYAR